MWFLWLAFLSQQKLQQLSGIEIIVNHDWCTAISHCKQECWANRKLKDNWLGCQKYHTCQELIQILTMGRQATIWAKKDATTILGCFYFSKNLLRSNDLYGRETDTISAHHFALIDVYEKKINCFWRSEPIQHTIQRYHCNFKQSKKSQAHKSRVESWRNWGERKRSWINSSKTNIISQGGFLKACD